MKPLCIVQVATGMEWRQLAYLPDYEISADGHVRRIRVAPRTRFKPGQLVKGYSVNGYLRYGLRTKRGVPRNFFAHRLVCEAWHGPPPTLKHHAAHIDGNKLNICPGNLAWVTAAENERHKLWHRRVPYGERNGLSTLTASQVEQIRANYRQHYTSCAKLAVLFNVSKSTIHNIVRRKTWVAL